jgi:hypothetical protein
MLLTVTPILYFLVPITYVTSTLVKRDELYGLNMCVTLETWQRMLDASQMHVWGTLKIATKNVRMSLLEEW